jgi:primase-polymerase (primpol)-like protein
LVLDFHHALEKLWKAAYAFHEEGHPEAQAWGQERTLRLLRGEVSQVIKGMRQSATKRKLRGEQRKVVEA